VSIEGVDAVLRRVEEQGLVENLGTRDRVNPEGCGLDFRLKAVYKLLGGEPFIAADGPDGLGMRQGIKTELIMSLDQDTGEPAYLTIEPAAYYLVETVETVNMPTDLMGQVYPRGSLYRAGLLLLMSKVDPGYRGPLILGLANIGPCTVRLQLGARICHIVFMQVTGAATAYRGQHQGGRVTPENPEQQM
jgi:deoxycytidine triphosphate deaminase